jgi:hypothetical protein
MKIEQRAKTEYHFDKVMESESQGAKGAMVEEDTLPGDTESVTE